MNILFSYLKENVMNLNPKTSENSISQFLNETSSGVSLQIKIQTEFDNPNNNKKSNDAILIKSDLRVLQEKALKIDSSQENFVKIPNFSCLYQKDLLTKLKNVPLYIVVNGNDEIITASIQNYPTLNSIEWIQKKYWDIFLPSQSVNKKNINLFFLNYQDACRYLHEVCRQEPKDAEFSGLKIKIVGLDIFYNFSRIVNKNYHNQLIGDLKEIDIVLTKLLYKKLYFLNPKQRYDYNWFQGTPIFIIKSHPNSFQTTFTLMGHLREKKVIFFTIEDALNAWSAHKSKNSDFKGEPLIEIYNLESLLFDIESSNSLSQHELLFVPPRSFQSPPVTDEIIRLSTASRLEKTLFSARLKLKNVYKFYSAMLWLLTSDTLPNEENSW
uniref:hypothetical protein n=1 Tax=Cryptomonas gyropyrenoidosa TaxID=233257 RepID=UPI0027A90876|nr:hypothetical protein QLP26_pgp146 [Cryptomonas gyropyrenoidosa]WFQ82936.1 hypothetical protein [Cryptomonas gyropyrenoidosa]